MQGGELTFTAVGEIEFNAYKEWYISWGPPGTGIKVFNSFFGGPKNWLLYEF
jgi:hypothetical protein